MNWRYWIPLSILTTCFATQFEELSSDEQKKFQDIVSVKPQSFRTQMIFKLRNLREYQKMSNQLASYIATGDLMRSIEDGPETLSKETFHVWFKKELIDAHHDLFIRYPALDEQAMQEICKLLGFEQLPTPTPMDTLYITVLIWQQSALPETPEYGLITALRERILLEGSHGTINNLRTWALKIARGEDPLHAGCNKLTLKKFCHLLGLQNYLALCEFKSQIQFWQNRHDVNPHSEVFAVSNCILDEIDTLLLCDGALETFQSWLATSFKEDQSFYFKYPELEHTELEKLFAAAGFDMPPGPSQLDQLHSTLLKQLKRAPENTPDHQLLKHLNQEIELLGSQGPIEALRVWYETSFVASGESPYFTYVGIKPETVHWMAQAIALETLPEPTAIDKKYTETKQWLASLEKADASYAIASKLLEQFQNTGSYGDLATIQLWAQNVVDNKLQIFAQAAPAPAGPTCPSGPNSRVTFRHREGSGVGYTEGYTTFETFLTPDWHRSYQPFFNGRTHVFNDGKVAINLGLGSRWQIGDSPWVLGGNLYYDWRNSPFSLKPHQIGLGFEALSPYIDFRANICVPVDSTKQEPTRGRLDFFKGNSIFVENKAAAALTTFQAEFGGYLPWDYVDLYAALGPYYLVKRNVPDNSFGDNWGYRFRLTAQLYDGLKVGFELTHDPIFKTNPQGYVSWSMPFGPSNLRTQGCRWKNKYGIAHCRDRSQVLRRMTQDVDRFEIILIQRETITFKVPDLTFVFVDNRSSSDGTFESPFPTLLLAQQNSKPGDIIVVFPGDGTSMGMDAGFVLQEGQTIFGTSVPITIQGNKIPALSMGGKPLVTNTAGNGITLAQNTTVSGLRIEGATGDGLDGTSAGNYTIVNNAIVNNSANGVNAKLGPFGGKMIANNRFQGNNTAGGSTDSEVAIDATPRTQIFVWNNIMDGETNSNAIVDAFNMEHNTNLQVVNNTMTGLINGGSFDTGGVIAFPTPTNNTPVRINIDRNNIDANNTFGGVSILSSSGVNRVRVTNNEYDDSSFFHALISISDGLMDLVVNDNRFLDPTTLVPSLFIQTESTGSMTLQLEGNISINDIFLRNLTVSPSQFRVQSPTGTAAGVRNINTITGGSLIFSPTEASFIFERL